jgi:tetratricopeptide (TPR) repeat protein
LLVSIPTLAGLAVAGCGGSPESPVGSIDLRPVPEPFLEELEPAVRQQIELRREAVDAALAAGGPPGDLAEAFGEAGRVYHAYALRPAAEACYRNAVDLSGGDPRWTYGLAQLLRTSGELEEAAELLERTVAARPDDSAAQVWLGRVLYDLGRLREAEHALDAALSRRPDLAAAHLTLGQIAVDRGDYAAAVEHYRTVLAMQPEATRIHGLLAAAHAAAGDSEAASAERALRGDGEVALVDPWMAELNALVAGGRRLIHRGTTAFAAGRLDEAEAAFREAVAADPGDAVAHLNLGSALAGQGRLDEALAELREAIRLEPGSARAHYNLGTLFASLGRDSEAVAEHREALALDPAYRSARLNLANALLRLGRCAEAVGEYRRFIAADPANRTARQAEAVALSCTGDDAAALARLEEGLEALPGDPVLIHAEARLLAASPDPAVRDGARALELVQGLVGTETDLDRIETLAMALAATGDFAGALRWQTAALDAVRRSGRTDLVAPIAANLELYRAGRPVRIPWYPESY